MPGLGLGGAQPGAGMAVIRANAAVLLLAVVPVFFPPDLMAEMHRSLGLGELARDRMTEYLTRSLSACYALHGAVLWGLSTDVRRYRRFIDCMYAVHFTYALTLFGIDLTRGDLPTFLMEAVMRALIYDLDAGVAIHAGVVGWGGSSILVAGPTGSGKSSIVAWLVEQGFQYVSDEVAVLVAKLSLSWYRPSSWVQRTPMPSKGVTGLGGVGVPHCQSPPRVQPSGQVSKPSSR